MRIVAIVQARMGSLRLPGKVMCDIGGTPMIGLLLDRLAASRKIDDVVVATSTNPHNKVLCDYLKSIGVKYEQGSEDDVLKRYFEVAETYQADVVVRVTGDCPLIDPALLDQCISAFLSRGVDYLSNCFPATFPDGLDVEVMKFSALKLAMGKACKRSDREHVTPFIRESGAFNVSTLCSEIDYSHMRWTVDEPEDLRIVSSIFSFFAPLVQFTWEEVVRLEETNPEIFMRKKDIKRNEGSEMESGQKLWQRAKRVIPGGNMLLSKRPDMFLPDYWPSYYSKAKGCFVWDLEGKRYIDMSIMGIGTNILGYGCEEVDSAVIESVKAGNMSTLNCPEEVYLAEKFVELHPWAEMVRFARSGGEANAIAIRVARAASGKDNIAVCGYHGWHDWYLAANLQSSEKLNGHLLPGLNPIGVPRGLKNTVFPFEYNDFDELQRLVKNCDIGVIKMEVVRNQQPNVQFLREVRELASKNGIVLIFDECTSGFRESFGGIHLKYGVVPDLAMFGKALGNGYAISALIGTRQVMEHAQSSFISSTFWTERVGPTAALKTLEVMSSIRSWSTITNLGEKFKSKWQFLADKKGLKISQFGIPALAGFRFESQNSMAYKTLITQEMLKRGFLATSSVYSSVAHKDEYVEEYFDILDKVFDLIAECENGRDYRTLLHGPICQVGFKRLN